MKLEKIELEKIQFEAVDKVILYSYNFHHRFIENIFDTRISEHLRSKFNFFCKEFNCSQRGFMYLYVQMDNENRKKLINYIIK